MATKAIPVVAAKVASTQTNFPVYIKPSAMTGWGSLTTAEANSIRFYSDSGLTTELAREVVSADEIHVKVPSLTTTTTIYADYDGVRSDYAVTDTYGRNAVWTGYESVYHLQSLTTDSSGNGYTLTNNNSVANAAGQIGDGADTIAASSKYLSNTTSLTPVGTSATAFSIWIKNNAEITTGFYTLASVDDTTNNIGFWWLYQYTAGTNNLIATRLRYPSTQTDVVFAVDLGTASRKLDITFDGSTVRSYIDGVQVGTGASSGNGTANPTVNGIAIGRVNRFGAGFNTNTVIDEARVAKTTPSADWITTEYNNQNDVATFWGTVTDVAAGNPTGFFAFF